MVRRAWPFSLLLAAGCVSSESGLPIVRDTPFSDPTANPSLKAFHDPAAEAVAVRVHQLGQKILAANPDLPVKPAFQAIGSPNPEVFHRDTSVVCVSQGLVNRCGSDAEVAAVLCVELGRMISERAAQSALRAQRPERTPPAAMPIGSDSGGVFGSPDATRLAELGKFDEERRGRSAPPPPPDPLLLGRDYLSKAGYTARDLEAVRPLLKEAEKNTELEKALGGGAPVRSWLK